MWQLMFTDIINNNELSIIYCDDCVPLNMYAMSDTWWYTWPDCILDSSTDCLYYYSYMLLHCWWSDCFIIIFYFITSYTHALFPHFLHIHWEFWLPVQEFWLLGFAHPGIWVFVFTEQVSEENMCIWGVRSLFRLITRFFGTIHFFLFILLTSFDSLLLEGHIVLFDLFVEWYYHVWKHYMYYCSKFIVFIVDLYNLFRSL